MRVKKKKKLIYYEISSVTISVKQRDITEHAQYVQRNTRTKRQMQVVCVPVALLGGQGWSR